ncbi:Hypothetical predicted protein [Podarcis lilfordi]|uniref:Uncharacterized protein n=1 Tax=Podarcis lilfordi TaxID=74358 RepID=A0AA35JLT2_9SAUR|nr:Hypothetical predicted protein [Podarcis lilfordi]
MGEGGFSRPGKGTIQSRLGGGTIYSPIPAPRSRARPPRRRSGDRPLHLPGAEEGPAGSRAGGKVCSPGAQRRLLLRLLLVAGSQLRAQSRRARLKSQERAADSPALLLLLLLPDGPSCPGHPPPVAAAWEAAGRFYELQSPDVKRTAESS